MKKKKKKVRSSAFSCHKVEGGGNASWNRLWESKKKKRKGTTSSTSTFSLKRKPEEKKGAAPSVVGEKR